MQHRTITMPCTNSAPARAREHVQATAAAWGHDHITDTLTLIASELVTNAVQAATGSIALTLQQQTPDHGGGIILAVEDSSPAPPRATPAPGPMEEHGRGLGIVSMLSTDHGYMPTPAGKLVWALIPPGISPSPRSSTGRPGEDVLQRVLQGLMSLPA